MNLRIGFGVDVHRLSDGLPLMLGGISVPSDKGAVGHSDADVLLHAICDAILGACNLRDIGFHFSDKDPQFKGIDSSLLLTQVMDLVQQKKYLVVNVDSTIILESPKVSSYIPLMQEKIAQLLRVPIDCITVKATTHEAVDSFGQRNAVKAYATVLMNKAE
ncbi:MAG: 2-C-methyl-D-erythritol 2,4-cyclodiphosphate synthase [Flavobacteriales bacterium]